MPWFERRIETVSVADLDETETERMWRRIDPVVYYTVKRKTETPPDQP